jgi:hypothetical protein
LPPDVLKSSKEVSLMFWVLSSDGGAGGRVLDQRNLATSGALGGKLRCANKIGQVQFGTFAREIDIGELQIQ